MIYQYLPNKDLTMSDVRDTLQAYGGTVGNNLTSFYTAEANINPFSKWKPIVKVNGLGDTHPYEPLTLEELKKANYGIVWGAAIHQYTDIRARVMGNGGQGFRYVCPTTYLRLGDFRNYFGAAPCPINPTWNDGDTINIGRSDKWEISELHDRNHEKVVVNDYSVAPEEIYPNFANLHRGVLIYNDSTPLGQEFCAVNSINWGDSNYRKMVVGGKVHLLEFLTTATKTPTQSSTGDLFYPMPYPIVTVNIKEEFPEGSQTISVQISLLLSQDKWGQQVVKGKVILSSKGKEFTGGTISQVKLYFEEKQPLQQLVGEIEYGNFEIGEEESVSLDVFQTVHSSHAGPILVLSATVSYFDELSFVSPHLVHSPVMTDVSPEPPIIQ